MVIILSDVRSCHTVRTFKTPPKHTCSDSLNLKPPSPLYPLQDFKALYKCCITIIIIIIIIIIIFIFIIISRYVSETVQEEHIVTVK